MASGELDALGNTDGGGDNRAGMCFNTQSLMSVKVAQNSTSGQRNLERLANRSDMPEGRERVGREKYIYI